jgi:hypothetical protein
MFINEIENIHGKNRQDEKYTKDIPAPTPSTMRRQQKLKIQT